MYTWTMNPTIVKAWNNDAVIIPSDDNEQFESQGNTLKVVVPTTVTDNQ